TVATFTDSNPNALAGDFTATINWGDGSSSTGTVVANASGGFGVIGTHGYADEGHYQVGLTLTDDGGSTAGVTGTATVADAALAATDAAISATEGTPITATVATFTDSNPNALAGDFTATINWGDGSSSTGTVVANASGGFGVIGTHGYADEGHYQVGLTITDDGGSTAGVTGTAAVADAALVATGAAISATEGTPDTATVVTFTDSNPNATAGDFTATINWGDGSSSAGTVFANASGGFGVGGTHSYADEGNYQVGLTITDDGASTAGVTSTAAVADAALVAAGAAISATEGTPITATVATFTDSNPNATAGDFTATINWGDGSSSTGTVVANSNGGFGVGGTHGYADEGNYKVGVTITDDGGSTAGVTGTAAVADADVITAKASTIVVNPNTWLSTATASFTDTNPGNMASDFTAVIDWGDGARTAGTLTDVSGVITVSGLHVYGSAGQFPVTVTLADDSPGTAVAITHAIASVDQDSTKDPAPTLTITNPSVSVSPGRSVLLPVTVSGFDPDDAVFVTIGDIPSWLTITDKLDGHTFGPGSATLTAQEVNSGLSAISTYEGSGFPTDTLKFTARNTTPGEVSTSGSQQIMVTDPPATGAGTAQIDGNAEIEIGNPSSGQVTFAPGSTGTLRLDDSQGFSGTVAGLAFDGSNFIDLSDILYGASTVANYFGNSSGGTLTVTDGVHSANIKLSGNYLGSSFVVASDDHGGTLLRDPCDPSLLIQYMASASPNSGEISTPATSAPVLETQDSFLAPPHAA
ncbi:MAG: hypothetical protein KGO48_18665, partial [Alphaproteobacteria bacterium]|nr:hypothetical protein [Alphaproteobacteria bacterium]